MVKSISGFTIALVNYLFVYSIQFISSYQTRLYKRRKKIFWGCQINHVNFSSPLLLPNSHRWNGKILTKDALLPLSASLVLVPRCDSGSMGWTGQACVDADPSSTTIYNSTMHMLVRQHWEHNIICHLSHYFGDHSEEFQDTLRMTNAIVSGSSMLSILSLPHDTLWVSYNLDVCVPIGAHITMLDWLRSSSI